jgi:hypothetical protein
MFRDAAEITGHLAVILAAVFQRKLEGANGDRLKLDHADFGGNVGIVETDGILFDDAHIGAIQLLQNPPEVFPIQSAAQAFAQ